MSVSMRSKVLPAPAAKPFEGDRKELINAVRDALYASKIISYAQGFVQLGVAGKLYDWSLNFGDIAFDLARRVHHPCAFPQSHHRGHTAGIRTSRT